MQYDLSIIIISVCRESLIRAVESIFNQKTNAKIQILIGIDKDDNNKLEQLKQRLTSTCPYHMDIVWFNPGYSTSKRHGGVHSCYYGGSLRTALSFFANSELVMYLDDDDWLAPEHCEDILSGIQDATWAYSYCIYSDGNTGEGICIDKLESVGVNQGIYAERFGGFVRPSGLTINKMKLMHILHLWSCSPFQNGDGEDRLIFEQLKQQIYYFTKKATVFCALDPKDGMHNTRLDFIKKQGMNFLSSDKNGSTR